MGRSRYDFMNLEQAYFITRIVSTCSATVEIIMGLLRNLMQESLKVYAYVILENNMYLLVQSRQLDRDIARFKYFCYKVLV